MVNKKDTVRAAKADIERDTRGMSTEPDARRTQGALVDRHARQHTPDRLYGEDKDQ
ncbi:hypothetical protein [Streptomyces celluloflavus]|uniref:hypothetical protein n=1 Tax=Streptomyces celluloflavus TaxID=58344 RepID=UPI003460AC12|nr:hypothetical protein OG717_30300 [Streptomyces celluloflavus]